MNTTHQSRDKSRNTDELIAVLTDDYQVSPIFNAQTLLWSALPLVVIPLLGLIMTILGYRSDWSMTAIAKPALFFLLALCCLLQLIELAKPVSTINIRALLLLPVAGACFLMLFFAPRLTWYEAFHFETYNFCLIWISSLGIGIYLALRFILHRARPKNPRLYGGLLGLFSASLVAGFYGSHCTQDAAMYIMAAYLPSLILVTVLGALLAHRKWFW